MLQCAPSNDRFLKDGKPFFLLCDTAWSAFTNPTIDEWIYYLDYRKYQGFNGLQINILPQGDRSQNTWDNPYPFERDENEKYLWDKPDDAYFKRAAEMVALAVDREFTPALVLLWGDKVEGTWQHKTFNSQCMPLDVVDTYVNRCVDTFGHFNPVWIISGDTDLPQGGRIAYETALAIVKKRTPHLLCTFHHGYEAAFPDAWMDYYMIYSGHNQNSQSGAYTQAQETSDKVTRRPIVNGEPCYEQHGCFGERGRFSQYDVRRAAWWSVLSGSKAGHTYGAHGVWNWHRQGQFFIAESSSLMPLDWRDALKLPGAWDMAFMKSIIELYALTDLDPLQELIDAMPETVRCSALADRSRFAAYLPVPLELKFTFDISSYRISCINLETRTFEYPSVMRTEKGTKLSMPRSGGDRLIIAEK
jgi:hypothetical protein